MFVVLIVLTLVILVTVDGSLLQYNNGLRINNNNYDDETEDMVVVKKKTTVSKEKKNDDNNSTPSHYKILLESFHQPPQHDWVEMNDPVMGGRSTGSFHIDMDHGFGIFTGEVVNVPFLHAPGFIQVRTIIHNSDTSDSNYKKYPDISNCTSFEFILRSQYPNYNGYRISFGTQHAPNGKMFAYGYKSHFYFNTQSTSSNNDDDDENEFQSIIIPFFNFTDYWDDATGDAIIDCDPNDIKKQIYCPNLSTLQNIQTIAFWGEGYIGNVSIEIKSIHAIGCNDNEDTLYRYPTMENDTSSSSISTIWSNWRNRIFGETKSTSTTTTTTIPVAVSSFQQLVQHMVIPLYRYRW